MEILEAFDLTGSLRDAAELAGCSHHTVGRYVAAREAGGLCDRPAARPQLIDEFLPKVEEWLEHSAGKIRADKAHEKLLALGYAGSERTTRRAVAAARREFKAGRVRVHRPWVTEPGMWLQYDFGDGPVIDGARTTLFCAWLAWSRFRVVLAILDKTAPSVFAALDVTLRRLGGAPTYVLTDNEKTVTIAHVAGMAVRNPATVSFARHYGVTVHTCEPADPASKGGSESTVKLAKADLVPKDTNLRPVYASFAELETACEVFCEQVNTRVHRVTRRAPADMLAQERARLHPLPAMAHTVCFGQTRKVSWQSTISVGGALYSVPSTLVDERVWARSDGDELVIVHADSPAGPREVARHRLTTPGRPSIRDEHYPPRPAGALERRPRAQSADEQAFLQIGTGAERWLVAAAAAGATRLRRKLAEAVALAKLHGSGDVDEALAVAADAGRFGDGDLAAILAHRGAQVIEFPARVSEQSLQRSTRSWERFGR
jgi:transposase